MEGYGLSVDNGNGRSLAVGELRSEAQAEGRASGVEFLAGYFFEEPGSITEEDGKAGDGIPDHIAETAKTCKRWADFVPVSVRCGVFWRCGVVGRSSRKPTACGRDSSGVGDVELHSCARSQGLWQGYNYFVQLACVIGVGIDGGRGA